MLLDHYCLQDGCGELAVPFSLHQTVAILLVEVEHAVDLVAVKKQAGADILAQWNVYKSDDDIKKTVSSWMWTVAMSLRLHRSNQPVPVMRPTSLASGGEEARDVRQDFVIPEFSDVTFLPVKQAISQSALACFIALSATSVGHEYVPCFIEFFVAMLLDLIELRCKSSDC